MADSLPGAGDRSDAPPSPTNPSARVMSTSTTLTPRVRLKVAPVATWAPPASKVVGNGSGVTNSYVFLDEGSDTTFCTLSLMHKLGIDGPEVTRVIKGMNVAQTVTGRLVSLVVRGLFETREIHLPSVLAVQELPDVSFSIPTNEDVKRHRYLRGLHFPVVSDGQIDILIGADVQRAHAVRAVRQGKDNQPKAVRTGVGWTLVGPDESLATKSESRANFAQCENVTLHRDFNEDHTSDKLEYSVEDKRALSRLDSTVTMVGQHYQVGLTWRIDEVGRPCDRDAVVRRLSLLKRRFPRDRQYFAKYAGKMQESLTENDPEEKGLVVSSLVVQSAGSCSESRLLRYLPWTKFLRIVTWIIRFKKFLIWKRMKSLKTFTVPDFFVAWDLRCAAADVVKLDQRQMFNETKLRQIMVNGLLRVDGRLQHSALAVRYGQRHWLYRLFRIVMVWSEE